MSAARWQVEGQKARLLDAPVEAAIDLAHPERGLSVNVPDAPKTGPRLSVLGFVLGDAGQRDRVEIDAYVRQSDLIATFERAAPRPMRAQVYWRWLEPSEFAPDFAAAVLVAFDLIASVNTSLLDVDPVSSAGSSIEPVAAVLNLAQNKAAGLEAVQVGSAADRRDGAAVRQIARDSGTGCFISRIADGSYSWVEMVHPTDFRGSKATLGDSSSLPDYCAVRLVHELFEQRLEKGVILRARIRGALVKQDSDIDCAIAALGRFSAAEPPLTV